MGWIYWALQLFVLPVALSACLDIWNLPFSEVQVNFIFFALNFICLTAIMHRFLGRSARGALQRPFLTIRWAGIGYVVFWLLSIVMGTITGYFMPDFANVNDASIQTLVSDNYALTAIGTVLLAPVAEELMYRGLIFDALHRRSPVAAFIVSTTVFAAIHVVGYIGLYDPLTLILCFVQYIPAGLCLGFAYTRSGTIWAPILMHIAVNQTSIMTMR